MRSLAILALLSGLAVCRLGAAAAPPQPGQAVPPADCRSAGAADGTADQPGGRACRDANLTQRRPGFWALEDAAPGSGRNAADQQPTVLRAGGSTSSPACTRYPLPVVVGGQPLQATIVACPQADGSWQVTQYTPGLPPQVYTGPPPPEPAAAASAEEYGYPESYAGWADWPWFSGFVPAIIGTQKFRHFRQPFDHRFAHDFEHRSGHDFGRGLAHGFGHGGSVAGAAGFSPPPALSTRSR
jgi:hypothetical protein